MLAQIFHSFSWYLEPLALIPQFVLMYRRQRYDSWVAAFTVMAGAEGVIQVSYQLPEQTDRTGNARSSDAKLGMFKVL